MPLNLEPRTGADFVPYMKFNAKAGRWYTKTDSGEEAEVKKMTALFDLAGIKTGWLLFNEGGAPEHVWDANGTVPPQPTPKHKRGFAVNVFSPKELGGLRELSSSSNVAIIAIKELYDAYEAAPEAKQGLVPVVSCEGIAPVKSKFGTNYQPTLKITRWVERPSAMPADVTTASNGSSSAFTDVPPPINGHTNADSGNDEEF